MESIFGVTERRCSCEKMVEMGSNSSLSFFTWALESASQRSAKSIRLHRIQILPRCNTAIMHLHCDPQKYTIKCTEKYIIAGTEILKYICRALRFWEPAQRHNQQQQSFSCFRRNFLLPFTGPPPLCTKLSQKSPSFVNFPPFHSQISKIQFLYCGCNQLPLHAAQIKLLQKKYLFFSHWKN